MKFKLQLPIFSFFSLTTKIFNLNIILTSSLILKKIKLYTKLKQDEERKYIKVKLNKNLSYSKKKLRPQKHTGKARIGSKNAPIIKGGFKLFGPRIKLKNKKFNKDLTKSLFLYLWSIYLYKLYCIKLPVRIISSSNLINYLNYIVIYFNLKKNIYIIFCNSCLFNFNELNINNSKYVFKTLQNLTSKDVILADKIILCL